MGLPDKLVGQPLFCILNKQSLNIPAPYLIIYSVGALYAFDLHY